MSGEASALAYKAEQRVIEVLTLAGLDVGQIWYYGSDDCVVMHITVSKPVPAGDDLVESEECSACGAVYLPGQSNPIKDVFERVGPGETMPAGECLSCGALTHSVRMLRSEAVARRLEG